MKTKRLFSHINIRMNSSGNSFLYLQVWAITKKKGTVTASLRFVLERSDGMGVHMNQFRRFMYGRYGFDKLSQALIIISLIVSLTGRFTRINLIAYISYIPLGIALYRILSKDINKRSKENYAYAAIIASIKKMFVKKKGNDSKLYKYYNCPKCKQTIRIPRGKGKICITCPKCKTEFIKNT